MKRGFFLSLLLSLLLPLLLLFPSYLFSGRRALIVGIDNYILNDKYGGKLDLVGCVNDALDMKRILIERFDFKEDEIRVLLNHNATRESILKGFRWLIRETVPQDWVIFSYSGHGKQIPDKNGDEEDGYDECICPSDVEPLYLLNLILDDEINQFITKLKDRRSFFLFDSCHSGTMKRGRLPSTERLRNAGYFARVLPPASILEEQSKSRSSGDRYYTESEGNINSGVDFAQSEGELLVFSAAAPNQVAIPINTNSDHPNGAMTHAVLMGLKGAADKNNDSMITYRELLQFSKGYMRALKVVQEPQIDVEPGKIDNPVFFLTPQAELSNFNNSLKTFSIDLSLHGRDSKIIKLKEYVEYYVESEENGYLYLFAISPVGEVTCLFPNLYQKNNNIQAGERIVIPPRDGGFRIEAVEPLGKIKTLAIVTRKWLDLTQFCGGREEELLHTLGSEELKELVRTTRGITKALSPAEWAAAVLELEVVKK